MSMEVNPRIGDIVMELVRRTTGKDCEIVLMVFEVEDVSESGDKATITSPNIVSSIHPDEVERTIISFAEFLKTQPEHRVITGIHEEGT